jgi:hypothetical protein
MSGHYLTVSIVLSKRTHHRQQFKMVAIHCNRLAVQRDLLRAHILGPMTKLDHARPRDVNREATTSSKFWRGFGRRVCSFGVVMVQGSARHGFIVAAHSNALFELVQPEIKPMPTALAGNFPA